MSLRCLESRYQLLIIDERLRFERLTLSRVTCPGPAARQERRLLAALPATAGWQISGGALQLRDARGNRGAIVNIGSIASFGGIPGRNAYSAAKAGVLGMTRALACEWAREGIRVNAVAPGYVRTALVAALAERGDVDARAVAEDTPTAYPLWP